LVIIDTMGDRSPDAELHRIGGQGVFVKDVQAAVLDGRADIAVHSAKDLPATTPDGLVIGAFPERADARDALVGRALADITTGGRVATGSVRRRAQLANVRPDLTFAPLRGNIETRLRKAAGFDAIVVAFAALERLGLTDRVAEVLEPSVIVPQVAQGALAVECRAGDAVVRERLGAIDDADVRRTVTAERAFLEALGGGCDLPCGAYATTDGVDVTLLAALATLDGHVVVRTKVRGSDPDATGRAAAERLLDREGGRGLLDLEDVGAPQ
ncbi:MAG: hydroxymethylbilane synthase, partial [Actinomycetota bacterium]|nr:hydroxymethylbilane synthase [Actinomycetota bacterium]